ncbi:hypothetical protein CEXT_7731 [Caerostris extrusa]|uniref:Uncharacterized protein n=1 Tax=Caerostris extrusa TaxID=172846 RepID=A0AAV4Y344_CAEEX|nr:hypothetical protein CEXT_7731 [Caerostris extrusa]
MPEIRKDKNASLNPSQINRIPLLVATGRKAFVIQQPRLNCLQGLFPRRLSRVSNLELYRNRIWPHSIVNMPGQMGFLANKEKVLEEESGRPKSGISSVM